jgi:hypothetical protein
LAFSRREYNIILGGRGNIIFGLMYSIGPRINQVTLEASGIFKKIVTQYILLLTLWK